MLVKSINSLKMEFFSLPENVSVARITVAAFASQLDFTLNDLEEIKVAVSEAVSNSIIHGYKNAKDCFIRINTCLSTDRLKIIIEDDGIGINDVEKALMPSFSTDEGRLGLGFMFMKSFMDELHVESNPGIGTVVVMSKMIGDSTRSVIIQ